MFGRRVFGARYFGPRYFGDGDNTAPVVVPSRPSKRRSTARKKKPGVVYLPGTEPPQRPEIIPVSVTVPEPPPPTILRAPPRPPPSWLARTPIEAPTRVGSPVASLQFRAREGGADQASGIGAVKHHPVVASMSIGEVGTDQAQAQGTVSGISWEEDDLEVIKIAMNAY